MSKQYPGGLITKSPITPSGPYETSTASGIWTLDQQAYWRKLNQWPIAGSVEPDPQFNYVTMLLHGDGTNGAQNNTFLDSSTNNFTITRNGNTTQGSFSPYGSNWSNFFDGSGDYLNVSGATAYGSGSFCFEAWIYSTNVSLQQMVMANATSGGFFVGINVNSSNVLGIGRANVAIDNEVSYTWANNTWYHIAVNRSGTSVQFFVNGTQVGSTGSNSINYSTSGRQIGAELNGTSPFNGYISNLRCVNASVYTSNFTPSTTPLTAIASTTLLTCQSNRFIDNSSNAYTITVVGNTSVERFNPFGTATAYSTSVIGGSGYFDGTGDYLTAPDNTAWDFGTGNFTVECWIYPNSVSADQMLISQYDSTTGFSFQVNSGGTVVFYNGGTSLLSGPSVITSAWQHCVAVRSGTTFSLYVNGTRIATGTNSTNITGSTQPLMIGDIPVAFSQPFFGYISDTRVVKGTAVYDPSQSTITIPTAPLTAISNTQLLTNFTNGAIFDNAMMNDLQTAGNAQISTSVVKYGTGSLAFDGTGDYLAGAADLTGVFGTGNFTIEAWVYTTASSGTQCVFDTRFTDASTAGCFFGLYSSNAVLFYTSATVLTGGTVTANTWNHIAAVRSGTTVTVYLNGTSVASGTRSNNFTQNYVQIGGSPFVTSSTPNSFFGYIDDLRVTKGYARYTATFTPPTAAFPNIGPT